jgi:hypothetical protein
MNRYFIASAILAVAASSAVANPTKAPNTAYVLQLSSNLNCDKLDIELVPQSNANTQRLTFTTSAFAAAELETGTYHFGKVSCAKEGKVNTWDILEGQLAALSLSESKIYYGGKIILREDSIADNNESPDALDNCPRSISRARGASSDSCRDGVGVNSSPKGTVEAFAPSVTEQDIAAVRKAFKATETSLTYLPLRG